MKKLAVIVLMIISINASAQIRHIGISAGLGLTGIAKTNSQFFNDAETRQGLSAGLTYEYTLKNNISISAGITYNQRGFRIPYDLKDNAGNPIVEDEAIKFNYDYLSLPLKAGYRFGDKVFGFGNIGIVPAFLVNAKQFHPGYKTDAVQVGAETVDVSEYVSKFDFATLIEIGAGYNINEKYSVNTTVTYQRSLSTFSTYDYFEDDHLRHTGLTLSIGVRYRLTKP
jgi:hypothetical protein